ncbi:L,D-transpeptidase [Bifidobacterium platyrrhinorum]|uniref:L,D-transpeptidase family protein n=1 Tax=Bifidobacterium platyrrhinorum TaxID=2661628 RepID=A0A6L9SPX2_9BIFI|nr:L,D-transpeptidase [Bifidobacterium platyrrhinorum]NEG54576.1 L,D-transpeptidase family protein [Bifidobacterium platyrrhinorum]
MAGRRSAYVGLHRRRTDWLLMAESALCALLAIVLCGTVAMWHARAAERDRAIAAENARTVAVAEARREASKPLARASVPGFNQDIQSRREAEAARARWNDPTGGVQPNLAQYANLSVDVSLVDQKVYVKSDGATIYTMIASTGIDDSTPHGTYTVDARGEHFYNASEGMGADYWVRFYGPYLFHTVPTGQNFGDYLEDEALKLGRPASHGCVRLSIADAKWLYEQLPDGTPVTIA